MRKIKLAMAVSLALAGSAGVIDSAHAMHVDHDNLGEVLLFPYYTVRNGYDTLISIVNTRDQVKAVTVRFLEGKNGKAVLSFNLYLSPYDTWTAAIVRTTQGAKITTADSSCTVPPIPDDGVAFRNVIYATASPDGEDTSLDRTREGFIEIIEMGVVEEGSRLANAATHVNGEPGNCPVLVDAWSPDGVWNINATTNIVPDPDSLGGLLGNGVLINVTQGTDYSYTATAIDDFSQLPHHTAPGMALPTIAAGKPISKTFTEQGFLTSIWPFNGINAVSAVLMRDSIVNTFVTDATINAGTDWVVSFPTKRFYVESDAEGAALPPFTEDFSTGGACEDVRFEVWNREEGTGKGGVGLSPDPSNTPNQLCWGVNVITFNNTSVLGSELEINIDTTGIGESGWMRLSFPSGDGGIHQLANEDGVTYIGLPVIGFAVQEYVNGNVGGALSNYGGLFRHAGTRRVTGVP